MPQFVSRILQKPPIIFPWIALFHLIMLLFSIWTEMLSPFTIEGWIQPIWALLLGICWLFICDLKKWAAYGYLFLTVLSICLRFLLLNITNAIIYSFCFYEITILFSFFILFFFRQFEKLKK